jgi:anti-sigma factor RsiW
MMEHHYIDEHNIADRYTLGKLSAEERTRFEDHFVDCERCLNRLEEIELLRGVLQAVPAEERARATHRPQRGFSAWFGQLRWVGQLALVVGALVLLLSPTVWLINERSRLRRDLDQAKAAAARWQQQVEETRATAAEREKQRQPIKPESTPPRPPSEPQPQTGSVTPTEISQLSRPQINTPIFVLNAVRGADPSRPEAANEIVLTRSSAWFVLSLELEGEPAYANYRATIRTADGRVVWRESGLRPNRYEALTISFDSHFFKPGDYLLTLEGLPANGPPVAVAHYSFRVMK